VHVGQLKLRRGARGVDDLRRWAAPAIQRSRRVLTTKDCRDGFNDLFIKRRCSRRRQLLIILIGLRAATTLPDPSISEKCRIRS